jgi:hypothetical protein
MINTKKPQLTLISGEIGSGKSTEAVKLATDHLNCSDKNKVVYLDGYNVAHYSSNLGSEFNYNVINEADYPMSLEYEVTPINLYCKGQIHFFEDVLNDKSPILFVKLNAGEIHANNPTEKDMHNMSTLMGLISKLSENTKLSDHKTLLILDDADVYGRTIDTYLSKIELKVHGNLSIMITYTKKKLAKEFKFIPDSLVKIIQLPHRSRMIKGAV